MRWNGLNCIERDTMVGPCERGKEPKVYIKGGMIHEQVGDFQLINEDSPQQS
jgi:hypothetical protein